MRQGCLMERQFPLQLCPQRVNAAGASRAMATIDWGLRPVVIRIECNRATGGPLTASDLLQHGEPDAATSPTNASVT